MQGCKVLHFITASPMRLHPNKEIALSCGSTTHSLLELPTPVDCTGLLIGGWGFNFTFVSRSSVAQSYDRPIRFIFFRNHYRTRNVVESVTSVKKLDFRLVCRIKAWLSRGRNFVGGSAIGEVHD
jgi:hypothetical protein